MKLIDWQNKVINAGGWPQLESNFKVEPKCEGKLLGKLRCRIYGRHIEVMQRGTTFYTAMRDGVEKRHDLELTRMCCDRCGQALTGWSLVAPDQIAKQSSIFPPPTFVTPQ